MPQAAVSPNLTSVVPAQQPTQPEVPQHVSFTLPATRTRVRQNPPGQARERQRLQPDPSRPRERREEEALPAEDRVLETTDHLDVVVHARLEGDDAAGVDLQRLAGGERALEQRAARVDPGEPVAGEALQTE